MKTLREYTSIQFSRHGKVRLDQRGISQSAVLSVIQLGTTLYRQSLMFIYIPKAKLKGLGAKDQAAVSNLIVVTNRDKTEVITCYKNEKAIHRIKKKSKRLRKSQIN